MEPLAISATDQADSSLVLSAEQAYFAESSDDWSRSVQGFRLLLVTRFWFNEGAWFGEASGGLERLTGVDSFDVVRDPTLGLACLAP